MDIQRRLLRRGAVWLATVIAVAIVLGGTIAFAASNAHAASRHAAIVWDDAGAHDLEVAYHRLHDSWNAMDVPTLKSLLVGDDKLATFDLDPDTDLPVKLSTKADMDRFTDKIFNGFKTSKVKTVAEHPMIACRVSGALGVCTEECRVQLYMQDGTKQVQQLRASAVAVNDGGTWRFIQWHMSPSGPIESYDRSGKRTDVAATSGTH
jgi:ketosteroid isomerase-like protein